MIIPPNKLMGTRYNPSRKCSQSMTACLNISCRLSCTPFQKNGSKIAINQYYHFTRSSKRASLNPSLNTNRTINAASRWLNGPGIPNIVPYIPSSTLACSSPITPKNGIQNNAYAKIQNTMIFRHFFFDFSMCFSLFSRRLTLFFTFFYRILLN